MGKAEERQPYKERKPYNFISLMAFLNIQIYVGRKQNFSIDGRKLYISEAENEIETLVDHQ